MKWWLSVFFVLTILGVAALEALVQRLDLPKGIITAAIALALAEYLIRVRGLSGTGIESGLWIGALFALIFALPSSGKPEAWLLFALAFAVTGFRLRNALFGAAAACCVVAYLAAKTHVGAPPMLFALVVALVAAALLTRAWERTTERLFAAIMIVMPLAAAVAWTKQETTTAALPFGFAATLLLLLGIRERNRLTLIAGAIAAGIAGYELRNVFDYALEVKLIAAGVVVVAIALAITRALRGRTTGFVVVPQADGELTEAVKMVVAMPAVHVTPATPAGSPELHTGEGSSFGGAGAGGEY